MSRYSIVLDNGKVISISQKKYNDVYRTYTLYRGKIYDREYIKQNLYKRII